MRGRILQYAVLASLSGTWPAWASESTPPVAPAPELGFPALDAPRSKPVAAPAAARGQLLYENHCMSCHDSMIRIRTRQQVGSLSGLRKQVSRWARHLQLRWSSEDLNDVVAYLNRQYYQFESR